MTWRYVRICRRLPAGATGRHPAGLAERTTMGAWPLLHAPGCVGPVAPAATARHTPAAVRMSPMPALRD